MLKHILVLIAMLVLLVMPVAAQDALPPALTNAYNDPIWVDEVESYIVGAAVNSRTSSTTERGSILGVIPAGSFVEVLARDPNGETVQGDSSWALVRWYNGDAYGGFGWVHEQTANLTTSDQTAQIFPACATGGERITQDSVAFGDGWLFDTFSSDCAQLFEGRWDTAVPEHEIVVLRQVRNDEDGNIISDLRNDHMTNFGAFWYREGSYWLYPTGWNMQITDLEEEPSIASMFAHDKRKNQQNAQVPLWPINIWSTEGNVVERFDTGESPIGIVTETSCSTMNELEPVAVNAIYSNGAFSGSIGAAGCDYVVFLRVVGETGFSLEMLSGTNENYKFQEIHVWEIPESWEDNQIKTAVFALLESMPAGTVITNENDLFGLPGNIEVGS